MNRKELEKTVVRYVRSLEKYCHRIPGAFAVEDIHDLRVDYKKLRAFVRLLKEERLAKGIQISGKLKGLYSASGSVRDLQLFGQSVLSYEKEHQISLSEFTSCLQRQLFGEKERLVACIEKMNWRAELKLLRKNLPALLHDSSIRQFINGKVAAIHILQLAADKEEDLHSSRKHIKDLLYVVRIYGLDWGISFPFPAWEDPEALNEIAARLGNFNDACTILALLASGCTRNINEKERGIIEVWRNELGQQVETNRQRLLQELQKFHLRSV